jgi:hypothetical protein
MSRGCAILALALLMPALPARADGAAVAAEGKAEGQEWSVRVAAPAGAAQGAKGTATAELHLSSRGGYHVNLDYPIGFLPAPDSTITFREQRVALTPAARTACEQRPQETCAVVLPLSGAPPEKGEARLSGTLAFSVCSADRCLIKKVALRATLPGLARR